MAGITLAESVGVGSAAAYGVALLLPVVAFAFLAVLAARRSARERVLQGLIIVVALAFGYARHQAAVRLPPDHIVHLVADEPVLTRLVGHIVTQPTTTPAEKRNPFLPFDPPPRTRFVLAAGELRTTDPPVSVSGFIRVSVEAEGVKAAMGDAVVVTGKLYRPRGPRNPGETDWAHWNRSQNIHAGLSVDGAVHVRRIDEGGSTVRSLIGALRAKAQSLLFEPFTQIESDRPLRLLDAMVLGHRSAAGRQLNEAFRRTGTSHFLAVSGFHVGVLVGAVWLLVRWVFRRSARHTAVTTIVVVLLYALIAEQNAPILRAATMAVLACVARLCGRPLLSLNWLALAALCVLAYNPLQLFRPGFQLSFVLVFALFMIVPPVYRWVIFRNRADDVPADADTWRGLFVRWGWRWFAGLAIANLCLWMNSIPLKLHHFGYLGPWSPVQSLIILPMVVATVVLGFLTVVTGSVLPPLGVLFGAMLRASTDLLLWVVDRLALLPGTFIETRRLPAGVVVLTYSAILLFLWHIFTRKTLAHDPNKRKRIARRGILLSVCGAVVGFVWLGWLIAPSAGVGRDYAVHVLSVGSGSATLFTTPDRRAALFDTGTIHNFDVGETVVRAARTLGVRKLDLVTISHANFDHYSGAATLLQHVPAERLLFNPYFETAAAQNPAVQQFLGLLPAGSPPRAVLRCGDHLTLGEASIEVLWPPGGLDVSWQPNDRSLVLRIRANGASVMIPGDIERPAIRQLLDLHQTGHIDLLSDVLIAPHHGAVLPGDTAAFYEAVSPKAVVVSTSRERPNLTTMVRETLGENVRLISTHDAGAVTIHITPAGQIEVETRFASKP